MSENPYGPGYAPVHRGGGCGIPLLAIILLIGGLFLVAMGAGGGGRTTTNTGVMTEAHRTNVEVMSRNQVNLWSDVQNCYGDYSCQTIIVTDTTTTVAGDRSTVNVQAGGGLPMCWDPALGTYTSSACGAGGQP